MSTRVTLLRTPRFLEQERAVCQRLTKVKEILREQIARTQSRPVLAEKSIKQALESYCRNPHGVRPVAMETNKGRIFKGSPLMIRVANIADERARINKRKQAAKQVEQVLRPFLHGLYEEVEDTGPSVWGADVWPATWWRPKQDLQAHFAGLYQQLASVKWDYWLRDASMLQRTPKRGWPKDDDMPARYHAAIVAVRLFQRHGLRCKISRSPSNPLVVLAKAIYGKPHTRGWPDLLRAAMAECSS